MLSVLTPNAVRLSALVAAAVSAGYLWRAALDHHAEQKVPVAVPPAIHFKPGAGLFNSLTGLRDEATRIARQEALSAEQAQVASASAHHASAHASWCAVRGLHPDRPRLFVCAPLSADRIDRIEPAQAEAEPEASARRSPEAASASARSETDSSSTTTGSACSTGRSAARSTAPAASGQQ